MLSWSEWKLLFERSVAFSTDSLHVITGVVVFLVAAAIVRRPISSWRPWLVALLLTIMNEFSDLFIERWPHPGRQYGESVKDIILTMALPSLLLLSARFVPRLYGAPDSREDRAQPDSVPNSTRRPS